MIPRSAASWQTYDWQKLLSEAITDPAELLRLLELDINLLPPALQASKGFPLRVPRAFVALMEKGNANDPLLRQVLPLGDESLPQPDFVRDPLGESGANPIPGLLHKYKSRVLLTVTGSCGINCRYCFRRHFPYQDNNPGSQGWHLALNYIRDHKDINEVIFSGGDPLIAPNKLLHELTRQIATIPHIKTLRIHSRLPIVLPERIDMGCLDWLGENDLLKVLVVHCNHPHEITGAVAHSMQRLREIGVTLLNQSVLLKGVNDTATTLVDLSRKLFSVGILPYYLHLLDKVEGAAHFDVDIKSAQILLKTVMQELPGYLVPKLVKEQQDASSKLPIPILF